MKRQRKRGGIRFAVRVELALLLAVVCVAVCRELSDRWQDSAQRGEGGAWVPESREAVEATADGYIKWVEFHATCEAMAEAYDQDVDSYGKEPHLDWIELLAYAGAKKGGEFDGGSVKLIREAAQEIRDGETTMSELTGDMEYYDYYLEAYDAVLGGMVGEFSLEEDGIWKRYYGLKAFLPIARGFDYSHYDDFGASRSYGYARPHLGHDMMGQIGTPIGIKYRACASENNAQAFAVQYTLFDDLTDQFVFSSILYGIKIVEQETDVLINFRFCFFQRLIGFFLKSRLAEVCLQRSFALIQFFDLGHDVRRRRGIHGAHEGSSQVVDGGLYLPKIFSERGNALKGAGSIRLQLETVRIQSYFAELPQKCFFYFLDTDIAGIAFCLSLASHVGAVVVRKADPVLGVGAEVHACAAFAA